jgi:beta-aspartyl-peptidase (threonine type)
VSRGRAAVILAHGGAGSKAFTASQRACLVQALRAGYELLERGRPAIDAVEEAIRAMEASGLFNAGRGSRLQLDGARRMDASIMEGRALRAGAVAGIEHVRHPISAARLVMDRTGHVLLAGTPATRLARHFRLARQSPPAAEEQKVARPTGSQATRLRLYRKMDGRETVGAVALDLHGTLAAGASTGGIAFMLPGRVGDTPLIGAGVYADNEAGAVSMTGVGESIIRIAAAKEIVDRMAGGAAPGLAARLALAKLVGRIRIITEIAAGALVLAPDGRFAIRHTCARMCAGYWTGRGAPFVADRFRRQNASRRRLLLPSRVY